MALCSRLKLLVLSTLAAGAASAFNETKAEEEFIPSIFNPVDDAKCRHGTYDTVTNHCTCNQGWSTAGITDTVDFLEGVCEQFHCKDDDQCHLLLISMNPSATFITSATCPVKGWNCYCGWEAAFKGNCHGYETFNEGGAECMGIMYTASLFFSGFILNWIRTTWLPFLLGALVLLPFGRKRALCDHHYSSLWNAVRTIFGLAPQCRGDCTTMTEYSIDFLKDDLAWSLYVIELGAWSYIFLISVYVFALFLWSCVLWLIVCVILLFFAIAGLCMAGGEGCGTCCDSAGGDCNCFNCDECGNGGCFGDCYIPGTHVGSTGVDSFYYGGQFPYDPYWGHSGYGRAGRMSDGCCGGCCCRNGKCNIPFCLPIAYLFYVFPVMPENMWGGFVGRCVFKTHSLTPTADMYQGGSAVIDFFAMRWLRHTDLHGMEAWRVQVRNFLDSPEQVTPAAGAGSQAPSISTDVANLGTTPEGHQIQGIRNIRVVTVEREFDQRADKIPESVFQDYQKNKCWICYSENDEWDMWLSCNHLYCKDCSTKMLKRSMPCPLCRVASTTVLRGKKASDVSTSSVVSAQEQQALLHNHGGSR